MNLTSVPTVHGLSPGAKASGVARQIRAALHERGHADEAMRAMSAREMFHEFCTWHGLINWSDTLWDVVTLLKALEDSESDGQ